MSSSLAVVPILTNAGVAVLPAILAGIGSVAALLLKPREFIAVCKRKPHVPILVVLVIGAATFGIWWLMQPAAAPADKPAQATSSKTDWTKIALEILRQEKLQSTGVTTQQNTTTISSAPFNRRANFARTGYISGKAPRNLQPLWEYNLNKGYYYLSDAGVHGDRVIAAGCLQDVTGIFGILTCLDSRGQKLWETEKAGKDSLKGFFSSPSITADGKYVVIGQGLHTDKGCDLLCYETATGKLAWKHNAPKYHIEGSPAILGDLAVVGAGAIENEDGRKPDGPGLVMAVRISTGEKLWQHEMIDPESSPAIHEDGTVYIGSGISGSAVVALRSQSDADLKAANLSRVLWSTKTEFSALGPVTLVGDKLLIGIGNGDFVKADPHPAGSVLCLDRKTGQILWQAPAGDAVLGTTAVENDRVYAPVRSGSVMCLQLSDGKQLWKQPIADKAPVLAGPAVADNFVYAVANDGTLAVLDKATGNVLEKTQVNAPNAPGVDGFAISSPIIVDGRLYVGSETGGFRCFVSGKETK